MSGDGKADQQQSIVNHDRSLFSTFAVLDTARISDWNNAHPSFHWTGRHTYHDHWLNSSVGAIDLRNLDDAFRHSVLEWHNGPDGLPSRCTRSCTNPSAWIGGLWFDGHVSAKSRLILWERANGSSGAS